MRPWLLASLTLLLLSSAPLSAACDDNPSPEEQLCNDIDDLASALKPIQDVKTESAREDLQQIRTDVEDAAANIQQSASEVPAVQQLQDAIHSFRDAVEALPDNVSAQVAIRSIGTEVVNLSAAITNARDELDCG
jgi:hypothetical protein